MNYTIVNDRQALVEFINWLPELEKNETYYLSLLARNKYCKEVANIPNSVQLARFTACKKTMLEKILCLEIPLGRYTVKGQPIPQHALALYITVNPRCMKKATLSMGKKCWDLIAAGDYDIVSQSLSCIQAAKSRTCYVEFDVDNPKGFGTGGKEWVHKKISLEIGKDNYKLVETSNGFHILVVPNQASVYREGKYGDKNWYKAIKENFNIDRSSGKEILLPVVGTTQGKHIPRFIEFELASVSREY